MTTPTSNTADERAFWRIDLCEATAWLTKYDRELLGFTITHSCLQLRNPEDKLIQQIDGDMLLHIRGKNFSTESVKESLKAMLYQAFCKATLPRMRLGIFAHNENRRDYTKNTPELRRRMIFRDSKSEVLHRWNAALARTDALNRMHLPYRLFSRNCNTVTSDLLYAMGVSILEDLTRPAGWYHHLPRREEALRALFNSTVMNTNTEEMDNMRINLTDKVERFFKEISLTPYQDLKKSQGLDSRTGFNRYSYHPAVSCSCPNRPAPLG